MGLRVLILAARETGYESVRKLIEDGVHKIVGVASIEYEGMVDDGFKSDDFRCLLSENNIPFWETDKIHTTGFVDKLAELAPDVGLSIGWRRLVKDPVVSLPKYGFFNFHASDLPRYRGFASTSWAIINGETKAAMTAHKMVSGLADHGDIYLKRFYEITEKTTITSLMKQMACEIPDMVDEFLNGFESNSLSPVEQDESQALYSYPRHPVDGWIDWFVSAIDIDRLVRALSSPYPGAFTCQGIDRIIVREGCIDKTKQRSFIGIPGHIVGSSDGHSIDVLTGDGIYTVVKVELEDGTICSPAEVIKGVQQRFGMTHGELFNNLNKMMDK